MKQMFFKNKIRYIYIIKKKIRMKDINKGSFILF